MNTTDAILVEATSEPAVELVARMVPRPLKPSAATRIAAANAKMNADQDRLMRLAAANTRRLSGKPNL